MNLIALGRGLILVAVLVLVIGLIVLGIGRLTGDADCREISFTAAMA